MRDTCPWCKAPWDDRHREEAWIGESWTWPVSYVYCPKFPRGRAPGPYDASGYSRATEALENLTTAVEVTHALAHGQPTGEDMERLRKEARAARWLAFNELRRT